MKFVNLTSYFKNRKFRWFVALGLLFLSLYTGFWLVFFAKPGKVSAAWFNDSWGYRNAVAISSHTAAENYVYISITIDTSTSGQFQSDCGDLRFTDVGGNLLPYYIVSGCGTGSTVVHVYLKAFPAGAQTIYYYYGNPSVANGFAASDFTTQATNYVVGSVAAQEVGAAPIAYWKFNEGYGTTVNDATSNKNNGTITSATWLTEDQCVSGKCLYYNGSTSSVDIPDSSYLRQTNFTVSLWAKVNSLTNKTGCCGNILSKGISSTNRNYVIYLNRTTGDLAISSSFSGVQQDKDSGINISDNKWHYVAYSVSGSTQYIYIDGALAATKINSGTVDTQSADVYLSQSGSLQGSIDDVKIYSYARTTAQIQSDFASKGGGSVKGVSAQLGTSNKNLDALSKSLTAYWKSDEATGSGTDSSGNGNTTTVSGSDNYGPGKFGNGLRSGVATTNINTNPSVETGVGSGWYCWANSGAGTCARSTDTAAFGQYSFKSTMSVNGSLGHYAGLSTASPSTTYTVSGYVNVTSYGGSSFPLYMREIYPTGNGQCGTNLYTVSGVTNGWVRFSGTCTTRADTTSLGLSYYLNDTNQVVYIDGIQIEASSTVTPYVDGSLGTGYTWSGTAHASTSIRTVSTATNSALLNNTTGTISFWFNSPSLDTSAQCPLGSSTGDSTGGLFFGLKSTGVYLDHNFTTGQDVTPQYVASLSNNTWYHVAYTWDNTALTGNLYVNGALQQTVSYPQAITIGEYIQNLGTCTRTGYTTFNGTLDDIRDYSRALSGAEVRQLYAWAPGPVGYWNFEEGAGGTVNDTSGNSGTGTWYGTGNHWTQGKYGKSGQFNSTDNYVNVGSGTPLQLSKTGTVCLWFKSLAAFSGNTGAAKKLMGGGPRDFYFSASSSILYYFLSDDATGIGSNAGSWDTNWHHVCTTSDGTTLKMYIDGTQQTSTVSLGANNYFGNLYAVTIGQSANSFTGNIDDVKIYNYARTSGQIVEDMNAGHPAPGSPVGSAVGYWKFDEGHDTTANNSGNGGSALNGTLTGATLPTWSNSGKFGKAIIFDGVDDYVNISDNNSIDMGTGDYTVSTWFNTSSPATLQMIINHRTSDDWLIGISGSKIQAYMYDSGTTHTQTINGLTTIQANTWYHLAVTFSRAGNATIYLNGKVDGSGSITGVPESIAPTGSLRIGYNSTGASGAWANAFFNGLIDEVKIYHAALTSDEIALEYNHGSALGFGSLSDTSGLSGGSVASNSASAAYCVPGDTTSCNSPVGEWNMEEGSGSTVNDTSGNSNTGTWSGTGTHWKSGKIGKSGNFNGTSDQITLASTSSPNPTTGLTIEAWIMPTALANNTNYNIIQKQDWANKLGFRLALGGYSPCVNLNCLFIGVGDGSNRTETTGSGVNLTDLGVWHHVAGIFSPGTLSLYVDGIFRYSVATAVNSISNTSAVGTIGSHNGNEYFPGKIDQVRVYEYARTPAQVAWDYNRGGPIGWWKMDECQGGTAHDSSGNGNDLTISIEASASGSQTTVGTCLTPTDGTGAWYNGRTGKYNSSLNFDSYDDVATVISNSGTILNPLNYISLSSWIYINSSKSNGYFVAKGWGDTYNLSLNSSNKVIFQIVHDSSIPDVATLTSNTALVNQTWNHIVGVYDSQNLYLYINGKLDNTMSYAKTMYQTSQKFAIGGIPHMLTSYYGNGINGQVDDVRVYNYPLTASQVKLLYNQGSSVRFGPATGSP